MMRLGTGARLPDEPRMLAALSLGFLGEPSASGALLAELGEERQTLLRRSLLMGAALADPQERATAREAMHRRAGIESDDPADLRLLVVLEV